MRNWSSAADYRPAALSTGSTTMVEPEMETIRTGVPGSRNCPCVTTSTSASPKTALPDGRRDEQTKIPVPDVEMLQTGC